MGTNEYHNGRGTGGRIGHLPVKVLSRVHRQIHFGTQKQSFFVLLIVAVAGGQLDGRAKLCDASTRGFLNGAARC
jgi:hypothetical protein